MDAVEEKTKRLCRIMHDGRITITMHDIGRTLQINWPAGFAAANKEIADELQQLVFADGDMLDVIGSLGDGVHGAMQIWNHFKEMHNDEN